MSLRGADNDLVIPSLGHAPEAVDEDGEKAPGRFALAGDAHDAFHDAAQPRRGDEAPYALEIDVPGVGRVALWVRPEVAQLARAPRAFSFHTRVLLNVVKM